MRLSLLFSLLVILTLGLVSPAFAGPTMGDHDLDGIDTPNVAEVTLTIDEPIRLDVDFGYNCE